MIPPSDDLARAAWAQLWQVTLLIAAVALVTRLFARNRPHLAYVLWLLVLVKCVTPPVWSSPSGVFSWLRSADDDGSLREPSPAAMPLQGRATRRHDDAPVESPRARPMVQSEATEPTPAWPADAGVAVQRSAHKTEMDSQRFASSGASLDRSGWERWRPALITLWISVAAVMLVVAAVRWIGCIRHIRRTGRGAGRHLDRLAADLSRRLRLRRPVRLVITRGRLGPAVIGLVRPTVVLPEAVVRDKSTADLEPMLAHELIHVRRGDAWSGMLQLAAQTLWWFHPLVWWAGRIATREAERCCDEAVVAELGCRPARYARSLLDVLERKQALVPVPAFPGVRPVDVTSRRLERIMKLEQGSLKRTPWWCWAVMLVAAAAVLPGAALLVSADETPARLSEAEDRDAKVPDAVIPHGYAAPDLLKPPPGLTVGATAADLTKALRADEPEELQARVYQVDDLIDAMQTDLALDEREAKKLLVRLAAGAGGGGHQKVAWGDRGLVVIHTPDGHEQVAYTLDLLRTHGLDQITIHAAFITGPPEAVDSIVTDWKLLPTKLPEAEDYSDPDYHWKAREGRTPPPFPDEQALRSSRAQVVVEKNLPVLFQMLGEDRRLEVLSQYENERRVNVLKAPRVTVFNGHWAAISDCSYSPFVVGLEENGSPQIRVVPQGLVMRLRPLVPKEGPLRLGCGLTLSRIDDVETPTINRKGTRLQVPVVAKTHLQTAFELPEGKSLLIGGLQTQDANGNPQSMLVMLRAEKVPSKRATAGNSGPYEVVYPVADLVVSGPERVVISPYQDAPKPEPTRVDFDTLTELIMSTVAPDTWQIIGGWGSIDVQEKNLSLVIRQTEEVHEEIVNLLEELRRLRNVQVSIEVQRVACPQEMPPRIGTTSEFPFEAVRLSSAQVDALRALAKNSDQASTRFVAKTTHFDGQIVELDLPTSADGEADRRGRLVLMPVVGEDRRSVKLTVAVKRPEQDKPDKTITVVLADGRTMLVDVTDVLATTVPPERAAERTLLLITPRVVVSEEEEETGLVISGIKPRIIIDENEEEDLLGIVQP
ncbi:MAG: M56 family metallopeptidase [Planctomycetota bacterium]|jgi:beta-lactamase regulating signal transducer with metallopeptidase domain